MIMIMGKLSSIRARGPCLSSPASIPDNGLNILWRYAMYAILTLTVSVAELFDLESGFKAGGISNSQLVGELVYENLSTY